MGKLIADVVLALECWWARRQVLRQHRAERWAISDRARVRRGVLEILR